MRRRGAQDPVTPELARYVLWRDRGCVIARLVASGALDFERVGGCRGSGGESLGILVSIVPELADTVLTIAHVRDRKGGRLGKRPPSVPRHLAAVCYGHHLADPMVDRRDVRPVVDDYLEAVEGPDRDPRRPWEAIARVRGNVDSSPSDQEGGDR